MFSASKQTKQYGGLDLIFQVIGKWMYAQERDKLTFD